MEPVIVAQKGRVKTSDVPVQHEVAETFTISTWASQQIRKPEHSPVPMKIV
jgi:hypothetical protein